MKELPWYADMIDGVESVIEGFALVLTGSVDVPVGMVDTLDSVSLKELTLLLLFVSSALLAPVVDDDPAVFFQTYNKP